MRVVIAEDEVLLREGLGHVLAGDGFDVVAAVGTAAQLERASKDPRIAQILVKTDSIRTSLQQTTRNLANTTPRIAENVAVTTEALPSTLLQAQIAAHELELLLGQLRRHWLLGGSSTPPAPASRRAPAIEVRP